MSKLCVRIKFVDTISWLQLAAICFLGAISPGPSLALIIGNTLTGGRLYGIVTSVGHAAGIGWWAILTAIGVAEVIVDKSNISLAIQTLGACLLVYIGFRTMVAKNGLSAHSIDIQPTRSVALIKGATEGFLVSLLNPKVAVFFLAIFSHFAHSVNGWNEIGLMGAMAALIDAFWYISLAIMLTGRRLIRVLQDREFVIHRISGGLLIVIAFYLFLTTVRSLLLG